MERTITYAISPTGAGLRIEQFLRRKGYSARDLARLRHTPDGTEVNGRAAILKSTLSEGDVLRVHIRETQSSPHIDPVPLPLSIVYEDEDLLVVDKPAGMPTHPSYQNRDNTLANALAAYYASQGRPFVFRCCNRLDRDTSGLVPVAKHYVSASLLTAFSKQHQIHRQYLGIVRGEVTPAAGTIDAPLGRKSGTILERTVDEENGEPAITHYRVVARKNGYSLVSFSLETGRTHQIRIHMKSIGYPLIGDYLYNPDQNQIHRQALHAYRLTLPHPITGEPLTFTSPLPADMRQVLGDDQEI